MAKLTNNVDALISKAEEIRLKDVDSSLKLSVEAIEVANSIGYQEGLAKSYWNCGISCRMLSKYNDAFEYFEKSLEIYNSLNDLKGKARVLNSIGNIYLNLSDYKYALEYLNKSLEILSKTDDKVFEASVLTNVGLTYQETGDYTSSLESYLKGMHIYNSYNIDVPESLLNNIGIVYQNLGDYPTSIDFFKKTMAISKSKENKQNIAFALGNIAIVYSELKDFKNALKYFQETLEIVREANNKLAEANALKNIGKVYNGLKDYDNAIKHFFEVLSLEKEIDDLSGQSHTLLSIGDIYSSTEKNEAAKQYYNEGLELANKIGDTVNATKGYILFGIFYLQQKKFELAKANLLEAFRLATERAAKKEIADIHKLFYEIFKSSGEYDTAFEHMEKHYAINKELLTIDSERRVKSLSIQFQLQDLEKQKKIALQQKEIYKLKNVELAELNDKLVILNEEKNVFMGVAAHDLKNPLFGIRNFSKKIRTNVKKYKKEEISIIAFEMEKASEKMLNLIGKMLDINAIESGVRNFKKEHFSMIESIQEAIRDLGPNAHDKKILIHFTYKNIKPVYMDKGAFSQIVENLLSNAIKFTPKGKNIFIEVSSLNNKLTIKIKDEGPGLTEKDKGKLFGRFARLSAQPTGNENSTGLGLSIVKKLTEMMDGNIRCESNPGNGAAFIVEFPLSSEE